MRQLALFLFAILATGEVALGSPWVKGGLILHPTEDGLSDRWLAAVGADFRVSGGAHLGFDLQGAYIDTYVGGKLHYRIVPLNAFATAKWKIGAGQVKPYVGGGIGLVSAWSHVEYFVVAPVTDAEYKAGLGYEVLGGAELGKRWLVELLLRSSYSSSSSVAVNVGRELSSSIVAGFRW